MSNDTTASASIDNDPEFQRLVEYWRGEPYGTRLFQNAWDELVAYIDLRAALARAPLPAQEPVAAQFKMKGETWEECSIDEEEKMRTLGHKFRYLYAAPAQADDARDAARYRFIEEHATMHGGGNGFTITCFVGADEEDMGIGIDKMIAASLAGKDKK